MPASGDTPPPRPLLDKLGVREGMRVLAEGRLAEEFLAALAARTGLVAEPASAGGVADLVFLAAHDRAALERLAALVPLLDGGGALWLVRPKGSKSISESEVMRAGLDAGLVDVKVVSFSATHTAHKWYRRKPGRVYKTGVEPERGERAPGLH